MKKSTPWLVMGAAAVLAALLGAPSAQAADVGVSVSISQPGVYGRVDIGQFPQPQVIVQQPVVVRPAPVYQAAPEPVYLWVPPGHRRHWARHCARYNACGHPVYFVREDWYRTHVAPRPVYVAPRPVYEGPRGHDEHGWAHGRGHGPGREHD